MSYKKEARSKLEKLKSASGDVWEGLKSGTETALEDLKNAYNEAISRLK